MDELDRIGVRYRAIVESQEVAAYVERWGKDKIVELDPWFQDPDNYDYCDDYGLTLGPGPGPVRNQAWQMAADEGADFHWTLDDNMRPNLLTRRETGLMRTVVNGRRFFRDLEIVLTCWKNLGMGGPHDLKFTPFKQSKPVATLNTRVYSFNMMRTDQPYRWRGRWNDDTILSLDMLSQRTATMLRSDMLMNKQPTMVVKGGNTDTIYRHGTGPKSRQLARVYPQYTKVITRFGRLHHTVNYKAFRDIPLLPDLDKPSWWRWLSRYGVPKLAGEWSYNQLEDWTLRKVEEGYTPPPDPPKVGFPS